MQLRSEGSHSGLGAMLERGDVHENGAKFVFLELGDGIKDVSDTGGGKVRIGLAQGGRHLPVFITHDEHARRA